MTKRMEDARSLNCSMINLPYYERKDERMKAKYKGYLIVHKNNMVTISKDEVVEKEFFCDERLSVKQMRTLINKHIKGLI